MFFKVCLISNVVARFIFLFSNVRCQKFLFLVWCHIAFSFVSLLSDLVLRIHFVWCWINIFVFRLLYICFCFQTATPFPTSSCTGATNPSSVWRTPNCRSSPSSGGRPTKEKSSWQQVNLIISVFQVVYESKIQLGTRGKLINIHGFLQKQNQVCNWLPKYSKLFTRVIFSWQQAT